MKKIMTKVLSIVMAAAMCIGLVGTALAAETTASTDTGTITISGVEEGLTVNAYKIAEAEYDNTGVGEFTGYKMLYTAGGFSIDQYGNWDEDALTEANLSALFTAAQAGGVTTSATADADGVATFENMSVGAYLFVVTGSESTVYGMIIGSVYYETDSEGNWVVNNGTVSVSDDTYWVKSTTPTVTKVEKGGDQDGWTHGGTADVGDTLDYEITVGPIPNYEGAYPEFELVDKIDSKLEITDEEFDALTVSIYTAAENGTYVTTLTKGTDYVATKTVDGFTIDFVVNGSYTLNSYFGQYIVVDFDADVISAGDVTEDDADHENDVTLTYATTSYVMGYEGHVDDADHDYTFNAKIQKTDQDEKALAGASFTLYTDETCTTEYQQNDVTMTVTSGENGYFEFTGLQANTYYFKETTAPTGYALNTNIYKLVITATEKEDGTIDTYTITVYNPDGSTNGTATVNQTNATVVNTVLGTLPSMGGAGIALCVIAGCVVLGVAIIGVTVYRRKNNAEV